MSNVIKLSTFSKQSPKSSWACALWGHQANVAYLFIAAIFLLFGMLGSREIWTQEHRWADIVFNMFYYHDFLHPVLDGSDYYDKPLLSYWLMAGLAKLMGGISLWALRLPSALAGLLAITSIYRLGVVIHSKSFGLLSGWMLLTTFYFVFWARVGSADMLNLAGTLLGIAWYAEHRDSTRLVDYAVFFLILSVTALCKGLVGPVVTVLAVLPDVLMRKTVKKHINWRVLVAVIPALIVYVLPFWASSHVGSQTIHYQENGLMLVYRENILRYFQPFDHKDPIYTYFLYLPIYLLPWAFFFIPGVWFLISRFKTVNPNIQWIAWATLLIFIFFTLSGSRRSYYVLPLVPLGILLTAYWIELGAKELQKRYRWAGVVAVIFYVGLLFNVVVFQPLYYAKSGAADFASTLRMQASKIKPWSAWHIVMIDPPSKIRYYLQLPPTIKNHALPRGVDLSVAAMYTSWPELKNPKSDTIFITRKRYQALLTKMLAGYTVVETVPNWEEIMTNRADPNALIAFVPSR